jgi:PKD repeat protein
VPDTGVPGTPVSFASTATPSNCSGSPTYDWDFGDGTTHGTAQNPTHTYASANSYNWTLTVAVGGVTCTKTGTIVVSSSCTLSCTATVPAGGTVGLPVAFASTATPVNCPGTPAYDWDFGDGTAHSSAQSPSHTYASAGSYTWTFTVSAGSATCVRTGAITTVNPPVITLMKKVAPPFKIVVTGTNLQSGLRVFIGEAEWTSVMVKKSTKIQLTGGASLKAVVPKGVPKTFRFLNADGGEASTTWSW